MLPAEHQLDATQTTATTLSKDNIFCEQNVDNINIADYIELSAESFEFIETASTDVSCLSNVLDTMIICCAPVVTPTTVLQTPQAEKREVVSYQRYGRQNSKQLLQNKFKCHLCGFGCGIKETLLTHFKQEHPT